MRSGWRVKTNCANPAVVFSGRFSISSSRRKSAMKPYRFPIAPLDLARLVPALVRRPFWILLGSFALSGTTLLAAVPAPLETFHLPMTFEQNRGQAPNEVKWLGQSSSYRVLLDGDGATFLLPD